MRPPLLELLILSVFIEEYFAGTDKMGTLLSHGGYNMISVCVSGEGK